MNLIIDLGNTTVKMAVFDRQKLMWWQRINDADAAQLVHGLTEKFPLKRTLLASVRKAGRPHWLHLLPEVVDFSSLSKFPFAIDYATPQTAGADRLANMAAAHSEFIGSNCLVVDFGSCITYSVLFNGAFVGGAISPGLHMRFNALHNYTGRLPLVQPAVETPLLGRSTEESIRSGVQYAALREVDGMIQSFCSQLGPLTVIATGGDEPHFGKALKCINFARPEFTLCGFNELLEYNYPTA